MSLALIGDGHADVVGVEGPLVGASQANLVVPVPGSASKIGRSSGVGRGVDALSFLKVIAGKAGQAVASGLVEGVAEGAD